MIKIEVTTSLNVPYTRNSENRYFFKNQIIRDNWANNFFKGEKTTIIKGFNEFSIFKVSLNWGYEDHAKLLAAKAVKYVWIKMENDSRFYFVESVRVLNDNTLVFKLFLDIFPTWIHKLNWDKKIEVKRQHRDRYDYKLGSPIYNKDGFNFDKDVKNTVLGFDIVDSSNTAKDNRELFDYGNNTYYYGFYGTRKSDNKPIVESDATQFRMAVPYKMGPILKKDVTKIGELEIGDQAGTFMYKSVVKHPLILGIISTPFFIANELSVSTDEGVKYLHYKKTPITFARPTQSYYKYEPIIHLPGYSIYKDLDVYDYRQEGKFLTNEFIDVMLSTPFGNTFNLDVDRVCKKVFGFFDGKDVWNNTVGLQPSFTMRTILDPNGITNVYKYWDYHNVFNNSGTYEYTYYDNSADSLPAASSAYDKWWETSKNSFEARKSATKNTYAGGVFSDLLRIMVGAVAVGLAPATGGASMLAGGAAIAATGATGLVTKAIAHDNSLRSLAALKNDKRRQIDNISSGGGSAIMNIVNRLNILSINTTNNQDLHYSVWQPPEIFLKQIADYYNLYGYKVGLLESLKNKVLTRKYFTFLQLDLWENLITSNLEIPLEIFNEFGELFQSGVRLWNPESEIAIGDYSKNNKELKSV